MVGGKPFNTEHKLNGYSHIKPIKQKRHALGPNRSTTACKEVEELMKAGILRRVKNQMGVIEDRGYKDFSDQIGRNLEAYVDDMVIRSTSEEVMLQDIHETLEKTWSINMKLNLKKCSFGVKEGPFLGHLITKQVIRAKPSKVKAVTDLEQPKTLKDIQSLTRKLEGHQERSAKGLLGQNTLRRRQKESNMEYETKLENTNLSSAWKLYTDEASSSDGSGAGIMLINPEGKEYTVTISAVDGNRKVGNLRRLPADGKPNKGSLRSQAANNQGVLEKDKRGSEKFQQLYD
ncbi:hypothetical protein Tco_1180803 [Tanacetum coccineum]